MPSQLRCKDLQSGDIMVKVNDGSLVARLITAGQMLFKEKNPDITHAGVMFDSNFIIEAQGSGIMANDLRVGNAAYNYYVYRCTNTNMAQGAGTCAKMMFDIHALNGNLKYGLLGAIKSILGSRGTPLTPDAMDKLLSRILEGKGKNFFCSQFVVYVYQFVAEQLAIPAKDVFAVNDAKVPTSQLPELLMSKPALFNEIGWVLANER
jgi:hypothetical protein